MAQTDPHSSYEQKLVEQGYKPLPEFAILDECDFHDKKTKQNVKFDKARLERLAKNHNKLIEERESPPVICLGHTKDHVGEGDQPTVTGVATRFNVQQLRDGKHAVFVRPWAKPGHEKTFKDNPYRSVELWLDPDAVQGFAWGLGIDRIAMLKYGMPDLRAFFEADVRWLAHYGFRPLDFPTLAGGLSP
jgi:hypothetical protein